MIIAKNMKSLGCATPKGMMLMLAQVTDKDDEYFAELFNGVAQEALQITLDSEVDSDE
jgi:hypothetical protein